MLTLNDGRSELWQWDTSRKMTVDVDCSQVHFSNKVFGRSIDVDVVDGVAIIPDILLQTDKELTAWVFVGTAENGYTKISKTFKVNRRNKPADYVFTPPEQTTLAEIMERIEDLEATQDPDAIKNAVDDYLANNPIKVEETDPTVSDWAKAKEKPKYTADEVGSLSKTELFGAVNDALAQAKESGEFDGKDGTDGYTPIKGVDYFDGKDGQPGANGKDGQDYVLTEADKQEIAEQAAQLVEVPEGGEIPDALPNPYALTFTGAVNATYDGSEAVSVEIPQGVEPAKMDRPKIFFGSPLQQTKDEIVTTFSYRSETLSFDCYAEIKAQGNSTMDWPKKNQSFKLYKDAACTEKFKIDFKGWGKQNKFVLKAYWRDLTHVRDIVSVRLEGDCMRTNPDYDDFPEPLKTSPNLGGIDGFPVVVYAAGVYQGRYMCNIPKDKWMYNMDDDLDEHCVLCSENYKSGCFRAAAKIDETDWTDEIHDTVPASIKTRWNEVISFVMNSTDEEFVANLDSHIKVSTLIDRHLMGMMSCDFDGYGKNQLYITYNGQQWYANRYDKDGTWGAYWTGNNILPSNYGREQYEDFTSGDSDGSGNLLFIRLEQLFWERLQTRWAELKSGPLSIPNIINRFRELYDITPPHVIEEDYASTTANGAFTGIPNKTTCTIQQIQKFVVERHAWMDEYVASLTPTEEPDIPVEPLPEGVLYQLVEPTTFNGTSDYIDTGVKLFDTNKDFSIAIEFTGSGTSPNLAGLFHCVKEVSPWPGVAVDINAAVYRFFDTTRTNIAATDTSRHRIIVVKNATDGNINLYWDAISNVLTNSSTSITTQIFDKTLVLCAKKQDDGTIGNYWGGTIHNCYVYNYQLATEQITAYLNG